VTLVALLKFSSVAVLLLWAHL